jgi:tetratricopeptide (TPR) repeat protein
MPTAAPATRDAKLDPQVFWFSYGKEIMAVLVVLIAAGAAFGGYRLYSARQNSAAAALLAGAKAPAQYQDVINRYPATPAGASACLLLAQAQRNERKFNESTATAQQFVQKQPKHQLVPAARMLMAANSESLGRSDEALALYQQVAVSSPQGYEASYALISQVRLLKAKKQDDAARQACEKVLLEHRDSPWAGQAMRELRTLMPKEQATMPSPNAAGGPAMPPGSIAAPGAPPLVARPPGPPPANAPTAPPAPKPR